MLELAREEDWEAVRHLSIQIHDLHAIWRPDIYFHCDEPYPKYRFLEDIGKRMIFVARVGESVVGYVILSIQQKSGSGTVAHKLCRLESICVDETIRRHGIGREMIADVRALARAFGCRDIVLGVHAQNDDAVVFYQKCGFTIRTINMEMKT